MKVAFTECDDLAGDGSRDQSRSGADDLGRQKIIVELYDKFFSTAFRKITDKLGIVYTPVEIVDSSCGPRTGRCVSISARV